MYSQAALKLEEMEKVQIYHQIEQDLRLRVKPWQLVADGSAD